MTTQNITLALASAAVSIRLADVPTPVLTIARQAVLDWFGVTVAGAGDPATEMLVGYLEHEGGQPHCGLIGRPGRLPASAAAALNGTASHALDYDDVNFSIPGHATAPVLAAALAVAEEVHATGPQLLEAFLAGYETSCRIGQLVAPNHYTRGFHATATLGCFGAAVASARLLGLDAEATARAMGIAATRAAGLKAAFGSSCKALQVGEAARGGLVAARLAQRGMDAPGDMLGHKLGFARTHSDDIAIHAALGAPRYVDDFAEATAQDAPVYGYHLENNLFKFHNSCYETHSAIECALHIVRGASFATADVAAIEIRVNPHCDDICNIASPATPLQARFSLRQTVAMALSGKSTADPLAFDADSVADLQLLELRELTRVVLDPALRVPETVVRIRLRDARTLEHRHDSSIPGADLGAQQARLVAKYKALCLAWMSASAVDALEQAVAQLEQVGDVGELARLTVVQRH
ncbi:MmgE/PrpD family protein [Variovorax ginsengisoli]|uniref:MmgE/PrpD family protein n=1 Tax=Variovorax ginsengisoli TaxID=363844 RepID=A0ABT8S9Z8_9BURK|nr:MmgE/PrpD family protein [Variovorax ginsengisoli]MDN8615662.1 MmgE/PrpD family protein [Variovorax ginsengisoli]MDO1534832.1 MmgE/PrpD family protein [Variovorax ginsengisoli]